MIQLFNECCLETMKRITDGSIDLMLTDPPYGTTNLEWDIAPNMPEMWLEWERILKPNGAWIFTAQQPFATDIIISRRGFFRYEIIWEKTQKLGFVNANKMPLRQHENVLVFYRSLPTYNPQFYQYDKSISLGNIRKQKKNRYDGYSGINSGSEYYDSGKRYPGSVVKFSNWNGTLFGKSTKGNFHPTQKPVDLFRYLIQTFSNEGDTVFDGYAGSATTAIACINEKRNFIGSELNKEYFEKADQRIKVEQMQTTLF